MSIWRDLYHGDTRFDFFGLRRRWFAISGVIVAVSLLALVFLRLDLSVDFTGGTLIEFANPEGVSVGTVRELVDNAGVGSARVQEIGGSGIRVQTAQLDLATEDALVAQLAELLGQEPEDRHVVPLGQVKQPLIPRQVQIACERRIKQELAGNFGPIHRVFSPPPRSAS